jgi:hypothetical protein
MAVSDMRILTDTIEIGQVDTIQLTVTNRANDTLTFHSNMSLENTEFMSDFDSNVSLTGSEDYTFSIFYEPIDEILDSIVFMIESNGGTIAFEIQRVGINLTTGTNDASLKEFKIFPNPATNQINMIGLPDLKELKFAVYTIGGKLVKHGSMNELNSLNVSDLESGFYILNVQRQGVINSQTFFVQN